MNRTIFAGFVLPAFAAVLVSCSSGTKESHNAADVTFAQGMVPHHRQAVEMSSGVPRRTGNPKVRELAQRIEQAQQPEIDQLTQWLRDWGAEPGDHAAMGHGAMPGMVDAGGLDRLTGAAYDREWLRLMIEHHTGAVEMARTELAQGQDAGAKAMAQRIADSQEAEITTMRGLQG